MEISTTKFNFSNKKTAAATTLLLVLLMTSSLLLLPTTSAHTPPIANDTYSYVAPAPSVIGVGQQMLIVWWLNAVPPTAEGATGDRWNVYIDVMKPDGTNDTFGPLTSDPVGGGYLSYTPTATGNYTCVCRFPGQTITGIPANAAYCYTGSEDADHAVAIVGWDDTYAASTSKPEGFTVQQDAIPTYQETPLPTDYWTRPI